MVPAPCCRAETRPAMVPTIQPVAASPEFPASHATAQDASATSVRISRSGSNRSRSVQHVSGSRVSWCAGAS